MRAFGPKSTLNSLILNGKAELASFFGHVFFRPLFSITSSLRFVKTNHFEWWALGAECQVPGAGY